MFVDIIKIVTMFISTIFKDSKKGKRIRDYQNQNAVYICISWYSKMKRPILNMVKDYIFSKVAKPINCSFTEE